MRQGETENRPRLVTLVGVSEGQVWPLDGGRISIGRQSSNEIQLHYESVSRRHCVVEERRGAVRVRDLDSLCGTFVNGLAVRETVLGHGDFVKVGEALFLYLEGPDEAELSLPAESDHFDVATTIELSLGDARYFAPDRVRASLQAGGESIRHLSILLEAGTELHSARGVETLCDRLSKLILQVIPAERLAVLLMEGDELHFVHSTTKRNRPEIGISQTLAQRVLRERIAVLSDDVTGDSAVDSDSLAEAGICSLLCAPLVAFDEPMGVIWADTMRESHRFLKEDLEFLAAMGSIAGLALLNAQHADALERANRRLLEGGLEHEILGEGEEIGRVVELLGKFARTDTTVLILGESGTGKELAARAIHRNSLRARRSFVAVNCATLSETLLDSELFGHEKGAFTGAVERRIGQFELAEGGTLFLDEVGEIPVGLQARLLRVLEERRFRRVGGTREIGVDVRIVAATNRNLKDQVRQGAFREDLYHRLNILSLTMPPLRERKSDLPLLARHFTGRLARSLQRPVNGLSSAALAVLSAYDWPGNVRELRNAIERAVVLAAAPLLRPEDFPDSIIESADPEAVLGPYHEAVAAAKKKILLAALGEAEGNFAEAAERLGLNRTYLHRLVSHLGLRDLIQ